ncbi:MAG: polysaccharide biosynthesis tyrosine autokinase [Anaerolineales bacterium]|nr:polysaccharide biosynthesis tyrosine autokinase [Anaerolineales bacterium]
MELNIKEYIAPLLKWWWLVILTTAVAGVSSYFATRQQEAVYRATTTLLVGAGFEDPNPSNADISMGRTLATFYVDMANRNELRIATADALGLAQLPRQIAVRQVNENFIDITVTDSVPERAQAVANELARQLILRTPASEDDGEFVDQLLSEYEAQIEETQAQIEAKQLEIGEAVGAREIAQLQEEQNQLEATKQSLTTSYASLLSGSQRGASNTITVIEPAQLPNKAVVASNTVSVMTAAAIGFVLSAVAAYVLEFLDDTIKTPDQLARLTGLSTLAGIAEIRSDPSGLITISKPRSPTSEAYRVLRTAIQFAVADDKSKRVLLVSSAVPEEGKSTTAANLAIVMAQAGNRVLLVDADLRRPSQHRVFKVSNKRGLSDLMLQFAADGSKDDMQGLLEDAVQQTPVDDLSLITCGPIPPNPSELLASQKMDTMLEAAAIDYDFVILDSPPVLAVTDSMILSAKADAMLMVVRARKSRKQYVKDVTERLQEVNANVLGWVLNSLKPKSEGHSAYYYYRDPYYAESDVVDDDGEPESVDEPSSQQKKLRKRFLRGQTA